MKDGGWACCCLFSLSGAIGACCAHNPPQTKQPQPPFNSIHKRNFISISFVGFHFSLPRSFWLLGAGELIDSIPLRGTLFICFISFHKRRRVCFHSISSTHLLSLLSSFIDFIVGFWFGSLLLAEPLAVPPPITPRKEKRKTINLMNTAAQLNKISFNSFIQFYFTAAHSLNKSKT